MAKLQAMIYSLLDIIGLQYSKRFYSEISFRFSLNDEITYFFPLFYDVLNKTEAEDLANQIQIDLHSNKFIVIGVTPPIEISKAYQLQKEAETIVELSKGKVFEIKLNTFKENIAIEDTKTIPLPYHNVSSKLSGNFDPNKKYSVVQKDVFKVRAITSNKKKEPLTLDDLTVKIIAPTNET